MSLESKIESLEKTVLLLQGQIEKFTSILSERTFPKVHKKHSVDSYGKLVGKSYQSVVRWIKNDTILKKRGVVSYEKVNNVYVITIDETQLD